MRTKCCSDINRHTSSLLGCFTAFRICIWSLQIQIQALYKILLLKWRQQELQYFSRNVYVTNKQTVPITKYKKIRSGLGSGKVITVPTGSGSSISGHKRFLFFFLGKILSIFLFFSTQKPFFSFYFHTKAAASFCLPLFLSAWTFSALHVAYLFKPNNTAFYLLFEAIRLSSSIMNKFVGRYVRKCVPVPVAIWQCRYR